MKVVHQRARPRLADLAPHIGGLAPDLALDIVECADAFDRFSCES
jgi:hypothetical protein